MIVHVPREPSGVFLEEFVDLQQKISKFYLAVADRGEEHNATACGCDDQIAIRKKAAEGNAVGVFAVGVVVEQRLEIVAAAETSTRGLEGVAVHRNDSVVDDIHVVRLKGKAGDRRLVVVHAEFADENVFAEFHRF